MMFSASSHDENGPGDKGGADGWMVVTVVEEEEQQQMQCSCSCLFSFFFLLFFLDHSLSFLIMFFMKERGLDVWLGLGCLLFNVNEWFLKDAAPLIDIGALPT